MSTQPAMNFTFDGYRVRRVTEQDRDYLEVLIECDDYHRGRMTPDFFLKCEPGEDAWALEDESGNIVFYFKTSVVVRMAIQFRPTECLADKLRNLNALSRGFRWIEGIFRLNKFREVIFDTEGPELSHFAIKRLGFAEARLLSKTLGSTSGVIAVAPRATGTVPNGIVEVGG